MYQTHKMDENEEIKHNFVNLKQKTNELLYNSTIYKDNSKKGTIDEKIKPLLDLINSLDDYTTLSSCSGRVTLFGSGGSEVDDDGVRTRINKENSNWYLSSHDKITFEEFQTSLSQSSSTLLCQFEPFVLHIACSSLSSSKKLLQIIIQNGLRDSGLIVTNKRITLCVRCSSLALCIPFGLKTFYPGDEYTRNLVDEINYRFDLNEAKIEGLYVSIKGEFCDDKIIMNVCGDIPALNVWGHTCNTLSYNNQDYIIAIGGYSPGPSILQKENEIITSKSKTCKPQNTIHHLIRTNNKWNGHWI